MSVQSDRETLDVMRRTALGVRDKIHEMFQADKAAGKGDRIDPVTDCVVRLAMCVEEIAKITDTLVKRLPGADVVPFETIYDPAGEAAAELVRRRTDWPPHKN